MFSTQEGEGWQQLGERLMPTSAKDAGAMIDGFSKMGDQALHSAFGGASLPDLHDALGAMFSPQHVELNSGVSQLPHLDLFDSSASAQIAPGGAESAGLQPSMQAGGTGTVESLHSSGMEQTFSNPSSASGGLTSSGPGVESLHGPAAGVEGLQTPGADSATHLTDASSPLANIGKAFTDIMTKMGDMLGTMAQGPMGLIGGVLNFLLTVFSQIVSSIGEAIEETAKAAASMASDVMKKKLETT